ncbi:MAG: acyl-ACP--UDP-N-acetylglucosamine O-acyltransferase [Gammaproteobacteria bacterium]|nr:acyl-ACP--UDP-N-acetylglucosamine O-acyltransferase [Gammaproteobacteria bacterium]MBU1653427.1 acyl-ACP--UDP-N-acetylglucosamine O-acyltransferase [Gammaproteobacteria bacterium]MBU1959732.1 acyl-ACP--UDP-N-acetylglucosamine O-acyltransferase [Gammaproteobacteria bacterium]
MNIHPTAIIEAGAALHPSVKVGPYSIIESGAVIGEGCVIDSNARVYGPTRMGRNNRICHGATIGSEPQDLGYSRDRAKPLTIGDNNHFKEGVNISHGIKEAQGTVIGDNNYFMAFSHVGHDCRVGDHNILANAATLGGHVEMEHHIFLSGHVAVHQFCRIGAYAMVSGVCGVAQDIPPFALASGSRARFSGLNLVGLRRNGFGQGRRTAIKEAYRILYSAGQKRDSELQQLLDQTPSADIHHIIEFLRASKRGLISKGKER